MISSSGWPVLVDARVLLGEVFVLQLYRRRAINIPAGCVWKLTGSFSKYVGIRRS